jgi:hypothetical protein
MVMHSVQQSVRTLEQQWAKRWGWQLVRKLELPWEQTLVALSGIQWVLM